MYFLKKKFEKLSPGLAAGLGPSPKKRAGRIWLKKCKMSVSGGFLKKMKNFEKIEKIKKMLKNEKFEKNEKI